MDENGLGQLLAAFSASAVLGALLLAWFRAQKYSSRMMLINLVMWYAMLVIFTVAGTKISGIVILIFVGIAHSFSMVSMAAALLEKTDQMVRGRIMRGPGSRGLWCAIGSPRRRIFNRVRRVCVIYMDLRQHWNSLYTAHWHQMAKGVMAIIV